jgi:aminocarboxymuconate-semialdehyde decarboxylase
MIAGRLEHGFATGRPGVDTTVESPKRALRRLRVDCIVHDAAALTLAAETFGADRIVFGSDWPFPMGLQDPHRQLATVAPLLRRQLFRDNPSALLAAQREDLPKPSNLPQPE